MKCGDPLNPGGQGLKSNGDPCTNNVVRGTFRCHMHGGKTAPAVAKAQEALALLRFPAIEALYHAIETLTGVIDSLTGPTCTTCGYPRGDSDEKQGIIKAAAALARACATTLDRTGLGPTATLEVKQSDGALNLALLTTEEKGELARIAAEHKHLKTQIRERLAGNVPQPPGVM